MKDWQTAIMIEQCAADERENLDSEIAEVVAKLEAAKAKISEAERFLNYAARLIYADDRIISISNDLDDLKDEIKKQIEEVSA